MIDNELSWPGAVIDFEDFLREKGLRCQSREEGPYFGDKVLEYRDATIRVRVVSDRSIWFVEVGDSDRASDEWYDTALIRDQLIGLGEDELTLQEQVDFIQTQWLAVVGLFALAVREGSVARLAVLRRGRVRRRLPGLFSHAD